MLKNVFSIFRCCSSTNDAEEANRAEAPKAYGEILDSYKVEDDTNNNKDKQNSKEDNKGDKKEEKNEKSND